MSLDAMQVQDGLKTPCRVPPGTSVHYYDYDLESEVVDLWNESFPRRFTMSRRLFRQNTALDRNFDTATAFVARKGGELAGYASGKVLREPVGNLGLLSGTGWLSTVFVAPHLRHVGIGRALVQSVLESLRSRGASRILAGRDIWHFFPGVPASCSGAARFFERLGFRATGACAFDLRGNIADFRFPPDARECVRKLEGSYAFRPAKSDEKQSVIEFFAMEFPGRWLYEVAEFFDRGGAAEDVIVACAGSDIVGAARIYTRDSAVIGPSLYWLCDRADGGGLGPIGVAAGHRGKGLGLVLLSTALSELSSRGVTVCNIDWTVLVDFYGRAGFLPWERYLAYECGVAAEAAVRPDAAP